MENVYVGQGINWVLARYRNTLISASFLLELTGPLFPAAEGGVDLRAPPPPLPLLSEIFPPIPAGRDNAGLNTTAILTNSTVYTHVKC